ncbi:MAG TPA: copper chaperone PCu(A)C [Ramlibacter sp.]|nr:copper chaperone PCu(A)C [Ramlibacter sp.]
MTKSIPALFLAAACCTAFAQQPAAPVVENAWVRASVPGQRGTGGFMRITAREATQLVGVASPAAGVAEVHEMKMDGDVMRMRALPALDLPAGRTVELKPGGLHLMLQELRNPLQAGQTVPLTLVFRNARGVESRVQMQAPVAVHAPGAAPAAAHHGHKH